MHISGAWRHVKILEGFRAGRKPFRTSKTREKEGSVQCFRQTFPVASSEHSHNISKTFPWHLLNTPVTSPKYFRITFNAIRTNIQKGAAPSDRKYGTLQSLNRVQQLVFTTVAVIDHGCWYDSRQTAHAKLIVGFHPVPRIRDGRK